MTLTTTIIFYVLIGAGVAVAVLLSDESRGAAERGFRAATALLFWPLYVPVLLRRPPGRAAEAALPTQRRAPREPADSMSAAIAQVEAELDSALCSLDGWAEDVLAREHDRFAELKAAWRLQADRIRELDRLLTQPEFLAPRAAPGGGETPTEPYDTANERLRHSEEQRQENIRRLREVRDQLRGDLMGTLAWVRELVTMIHLAKFTGAPASRAEELVGQIAAAVEGLSEVSAWRDEELAGAPSA